MKQAILQLLLEHRDRYISGEDISKALQVSRTAIWKHINSLKSEGYEIEAVPRLGYRLAKRPDILVAEEIKIGLNTTLIGRQLSVFQQVSSTNDTAKKLAAAGEPEGLVVLAEEQLAGRGRLGRLWGSPAGMGLWFSLILRPPLRPALAPQLIFVSAVAVCKALRTATGLEVSLKWPNDVVYSGKKLCGILTELSAEIDLINYVVVGIGINVNQEEKDFSPELKERAISLALIAGRPFRRVEILQAVLEEMEGAYLGYLQRGFSYILDLWRELNSTLGRQVTVAPGEGSIFSGVAVDIDDNGCLMVKTASGEMRQVMVGDVSVRDISGAYL